MTCDFAMLAEALGARCMPPGSVHAQRRCYDWLTEEVVTLLIGYR